jgi:[acyl-carrier-protein] S-malonyltransferase
MRHPEMLRDQISGFPDVVSGYLDRAARVVDVDRRKFESPATVSLPDSLQDTMQAQYACYIDSVAMGKVLLRHFPRAEYVAGYSMGLFATLCYSGAVSFEEGLVLLREICVLAHDHVGDQRYGMGAVMGLTPDEIGRVIETARADVEISDQLGARSAVISGKCDQVEQVLESSLDFGALNVKLIPVTLPFHSSYLAPLESSVRQLLNTTRLANPTCRIVSSITQETLTDQHSVREEVARNIYRPMNWLATMRKLLDAGVDSFLECGLSENLANIARRNVRGNYTVHCARDYRHLLMAAG